MRRSPLHEHLKARGRCSRGGRLERANWFANPGQEARYDYSWKRQNWFENQRAEHLAVREGVGLFDMTSFGKIRVEGRDACAFLQRVCANDVDVEAGRIVLHADAQFPRRDRERSDRDAAFGTAFLLVVPARRCSATLPGCAAMWAMLSR